MLTSHPAVQTIEFTREPASNRPITVPVTDPFTSRLARAPIRSLKPHEQLFREGDDKVNIYQVVDGAFVLYRLLSNGRRQVIGFAVRGDLVGLGAGLIHRCTAEASSFAKVRAMSASALYRLASEDSTLGLRLYDAMSRELATAQDLLMTVSRLNAGERIATFLLDLAARKHGAGLLEGCIELPMTRCDIGDFLGLTTETVSRTLTKLANNAIISRHQGYIRILDGEALEDVAAGAREA